MSTHTPGPWSVRQIKGHAGDLVYCLIGQPESLPKLRGGVAFAGTYVKKPRTGLPTVEGARIAEAEAKANARLIATAPGMVDALLECIRVIENDGHLISCDDDDRLQRAAQKARDVLAKAGVTQ